MERAPPAKSRKTKIKREILRQLYVDENMSTVEMAKKLNTTRPTLLRLLREERLSRKINGLC